MKRIITILAGLALLISCSKSDEVKHLENLNKELSTNISNLQSNLQIARKAQLKFQFLTNKLRGIKATIVTNHGDIEVKFDPKVAPLHVFSFVTRAESGFYDGTQFHRIMKGFMIQGGDSNSKKYPADFVRHGSGEPIVAIPHEFNSKKHLRGVLSTARNPDKSRGAGSQFFIMHAENSGLNNDYTAFGEVTKGMDVVDKIASLPRVSVPRNPNHPKNPVIIKTIKVYR